MSSSRELIAPIDWRQPWLAPWASTGRPVEAAWWEGASLAQALNLAAGHATHPARTGEPGRLSPPNPVSMQFVPQAELPEGMPYEQYIFESGRCPTREGLHDFFNGLAWLRYPRTKRRLNQLQATQIAAGAMGGRRGPVRDAATVFDENAAFLSAPPPLCDALARADWHGLFVRHRSLWASARLHLFGHALLEKLVSPRKPITTHVCLIPEGLADLADIDPWVAAQLSEASLASKPFSPMPVLGVPGWWPANEHPAFYDDAEVFRPRRPKPQ